MQKYNLNDYVIIYPTPNGWEKIKEIMSETKFRGGDASEYVQNRITSDGGFKEQLWDIMHYLGPIFYNGSHYLKSEISLCHEI